jgi:hypothetical protein
MSNSAGGAPLGPEDYEQARRILRLDDPPLGDMRHAELYELERLITKYRAEARQFLDGAEPP